MSTAAVDLKSWTREHLTSLYTASSDDDFQSAFDDTFAPEAEDKTRMDIVINGESLGTEKFRDELRAQRGAMVKADVKFDDLEESAVHGDNEAAGGTGDQAAIVKGKWTVTRSLKFRIRAAPAQMLRISTFEARVEPVPPGSNDYRITRFSESVENKQAPIVFNTPRRVAGGEPHDETQVEDKN